MIPSPHLQAMGVQQWVRRSLPQQEAPVVEVVSEATTTAVVDFSDRIEISGRADAELLLIVPRLEAAAEQLLGKMLVAIGLGQQHCYRVTLTEPSLCREGGGSSYLQQLVAQSSCKARLQLGSDPLSLEGLLVTHDPAYLLSHPEEKRAAWEVLKQVHAQLHP